MKIPFRFLVVSMIFTLGTAVLAEGFQMERITVGSKYIDGEDQQNWIYFNSNTNYDWMQMNLQGKFYCPELSENWVDYSQNGMGDLYSGVKANFKFPGLSKGFDASMGYKWNKNYKVSLWGVGYGWGFGKDLSMGVRYDEAYRRQRISDTNNDGKVTEGEADHPGDMDRKQQEFYLNYTPNRWGYFLDAKRIDRDFINASPADEYFTPAYLTKYHKYSKDYSSLATVLDQKVTCKVTSKLDMGLRYITTDTEYDDYQKEDGDSKKWILDGTYKATDNWTWSGSLSKSDYEGYDGKTTADGLALKAKYTSDSNWWYAAKLYLYDLSYDAKYHALYDNVKKDKDADYFSRTQQVAALEYEQKLERYSYNLEVFVKNYVYDDVDDYLSNSTRSDDTRAGIIGTLTWDAIGLHWLFRVAPNGDLTTRKANAEIRATYKF